MLTALYPSPCGSLLLGVDDDAVCLCDWLIRPCYAPLRLAQRPSAECVNLHTSGASQSPAVSQLLNTLRAQLDAYFRGGLHTFSLPLRPAGTTFQQSVWAAITEVPYGQTLSYAALAQSIGRPTAVRAVARAVGANPLALLIPCHRIIGSDGSLTGYAGGLAAKRWLLSLENQ